MALRVISGTEPIEIKQLVMTIYKAPGIGGTTLGFTADAPLLLDFDSGLHRAVNRRDAVQVTQWQDIAHMDASDFADRKTVVVDTIGRALDIMGADIMRREPKLGYGGALTLQGYGRLAAQFTGWLATLRSYGLDIVLMAHVEEDHKGDDIIERIDARGKSKNEVYKQSDAMGRLALRGGKRVLLFSPTETSFGKNPAQYGELVVPTMKEGVRCSFLGDLIRETKTKINEMNARQVAVSSALAGWHERVKMATSAKKLNELLADVEAIDPTIRDNAKRILWAEAKDHGFEFSKDKGFVEAA